MIQEEQNQQLGYLTLRAQESISRALYETVAQSIHKKINKYHNRAGRVPFRKMRDTRDEVRIIPTAEDMKGFNKICKKYGIRYSIEIDPTDENQYLMFFEAKNEEKMAQALKEFYQDYTREFENMDLDESLEAKQNKNEQPKNSKDNKDKKKAKEKGLNEKLDHYIEKSKGDSGEKDKTIDLSKNKKKERNKEKVMSR